MSETRALCSAYRRPKITFASETSAVRHLREYRNQLRAGDNPLGLSPVSLYVFQCATCEEWHIGSGEVEVKRLKNRAKKQRERRNRRQRTADAIRQGPEWLTLEQAALATRNQAWALEDAVGGGFLRRYPQGFHNIGLAAWVEGGTPK